MKDIYTWHNDLYPLARKRFDLRYAKRLDLISGIVDVACQDNIDYRLEGFDKPKLSKEEKKEDKNNA